MDAESETLIRLAAIRDTVASHARNAVAQQDLEALRGVIAAAFENVYLRPDGGIARMTPGVRLEGMFQMVAEHDGDLVTVPRYIENGALEAERFALPLAAESNVKVSSRTL